MKIIEIDINRPINNTQPLSLCMGYFDGIHLGHQKLVSNAINYAKDFQLSSALLTFDPDPVEVLSKKKKQHITTIDERIEIAEELGLQYIIILKTDSNLLSLSPMQFIESVLIPLNVKHITCGFDFRFGSKGVGTPDTLKELSLNRYSVSIIEKFELTHEKVSSSRIIEYLINGHVDLARKCLGRPYFLYGKVVKGNQQGRLEGYPTINLEWNEEKVLVKQGVYATSVVVEGVLYPSMTNVGFNLTYNHSQYLKIETHIIGFDENIYGKTVKLNFLKFLRDEKKFNSISDLTNQMDLDKEESLKVFKCQ